MNWWRSKLWVGGTALLAPLPLPFNEMAVWPATIAYLILVGGWMLAVWRGAAALLPPWALNLLGALYLPVLLFDLAAAQGGQVLRPLVHVAMFATAAKLFALRGERDKWHALLGSFFLFVAGMGSSVHPALVLHMLVFSTVAVAGLVHFAEVQSLRPFPAGRPIPGKRALISGVILLSVIGCAILFPVLPRVTQPYVVGGGAVDLGGAGGAAAFVDDLTLDSIGRIRSDRGVALRLVFDGPVPDEIRLKGSSYDRYDGHRWKRTPGSQFLRTDNGWIQLVERQLKRGEVEVYSRVSGSPMLPIIVQGLSLESEAPWLGLAPGGDVRPLRWRGAPMRYRMAYGADAVTLATSPPNPETLDRAGITAGIGQYAQRYLRGPDTPLDRVRLLERHLQEDFDYSLELDLEADNPVEDFLLRKQSGHCEYFASSMVLMLRSQGIPARVVSGFLGAEGNPLEAFYVVRNANAHAWVEAWVDGAWQILDPTPAAARPTQVTRSSIGWWQRLMDTYDWLIFRWDRYVLTYSSQEQTNVFRAAWGWLKDVWGGLWGDEEVDEPSPGLEAPVIETVSEVVEGTTEAPEKPWWWLVVIAALLAAVATLGWWKRRRESRMTATAIYLRLREVAPQVGIEADETSAPETVVEPWMILHPALKRELRLILDTYLEESFGGREVGRDELSDLEAGWEAIRDNLPRAA